MATSLASTPDCSDEWSNAYVGLPYRLGGRDRSGLDCWGLIEVVYRERLGIDIGEHHAIDPGPDGWYEDAEREVARYIPEWCEIERPAAMDGLLFKIKGHPCHTGLWVAPDLFLHSFNERPVGIERLSRGWSNRLLGMYRHRLR